MYLKIDVEHGQYREVSDSELFSLVSEVRIERLNLCKRLLNQQKTKNPT